MTNGTQQQQIMKVLAHGRWMNAESLASALGVEKNTVYRRISKMIKAGIVERNSTFRTSSYRLKPDSPDQPDDVAGSRTYVNGSMPAGSPEWWAGFLANQFVR